MRVEPGLARGGRAFHSTFLIGASVIPDGSLSGDTAGIDAVWGLIGKWQLIAEASFPFSDYIAALGRCMH